MLSDTQKTFVFAFVMCLCCSLALTAAAVGLKDRQERNIALDKQKNILKALALVEPGKKYTANEIGSIYDQNVKNVYLNASNQLTRSETDKPVFIVGSLDSVKRYAVPFKAYGLWSWIYGFMALEGDGNTVAGITVYNHGETPGLGGECEKPWFQNQFIGKTITDSNGDFVSIGIVKGKVADKIAADKQHNYVDGMSGATITSKGMEKHIKMELERYEQFSAQLRASQEG